MKIKPYIHGGSQEQERRAGTSNVPAIVAMGEAARLSGIEMKKHTEYVTKLREYAIMRIFREIPFVRLNGHRYKRLPGNMNFCFQFVDGVNIQVMLDMKGVCVSTGSACSTGSGKASHVLLAIGLNEELASNVIRMSISYTTTKKEIDEVINYLKEIVYKQRQLSKEDIEITKPYRRYGWRR